MFKRKKKEAPILESFDNPNFGYDQYADIDDYYGQTEKYNENVSSTENDLINTEYNLPGSGINLGTDLPGTGTEFTTYADQYTDEEDDENGYMTIGTMPREKVYEVEYDEEVSMRNTLIQNWIDGKQNEEEIDLSEYETKTLSTPTSTHDVIMLDDRFLYSKTYSVAETQNSSNLVIHLTESNSQETYQSDNLIKVSSNLSHLMDEELLEQIHEGITLALGNNKNILFSSENFDKVVFLLIAFKILALQEYVPFYEVYNRSLCDEAKKMIQQISNKYDKKKGIAVKSIQNIFPEIPDSTILDLLESGLSTNQIIEQFIS